MLRLRRKSPGKAGARVALLSGAAVAALGLGALNAGSAAAAPCAGTTITGQGSSLQNVAQTKVWAPGFQAICPKIEIKYNSTGSGAGLEQWNHNNVTKSINTGLSFIGTDDAPTATQIGNIESVAGGAKLAVIPVAQTAISVVANLPGEPGECELEGISNSNLAGIMEGRINNWSKVTGHEGECNGPIVRVVRKDGSGTTFQFKNYLYQLFKIGLPCTVGGTEGKKSWAELEENGAGGKPNIEWPEACEEKPTLSQVIHPLNNGGGEVVKLVNNTDGGVGYAALPDAEGNLVPGTTTLMKLQNNGQKTEVNLAKATGTGETANCSGAVYTGFKLNSGLDIDWSSVFGAKPAIGAKNYPLCTLTYALAFHGYKSVPPYKEAPFTEGQELTTREYLNDYIVQAAGQAAIASHWYSPLPSSAEERFDVLGAARKAAKTISY